jgi:hypothetical protein
MSRQPPVTVEPPRPEDIGPITGWLCEPAIYEDAFMLAARPDPAWIEASMLLVKNNLRTEFQPVRLWSVRDLDQQLIGVGIDYGWEHAQDSDRELDFALPLSTRGSAILPIYTLAAIIDRIFHDHDATAVWGRVRAGASGEGFARMFETIGGAMERVRWDTQPTTGRRLQRIYYSTHPDTFYASRFGARARRDRHERGQATSIQLVD